MSESQGLVGQLLLGKLEVLRHLGGGGMGVVYEVEHRLTGHRRALKVVKPQYAERPRFMKRLLREAKVAGTLGSDYVVETYDAGRLEDGSAYVLMELLEGQNLYEVIQEEGTIEPKRLASIMIQVAEGIACAHAASIIHRDLKPENIFLVEDAGHDRVKILDFGVSKFDVSTVPASRLTAEGTLVGTPYYMSPEQAGGRDVDARSDVYALGVMIYEALVGRLPYEAATVGELFVKIGAGQCVPLDVRRPDLDPEWARIVHKAFNPDPEQRYPTVEALRRDLLPLARSTAAARAKTISDGVRATLAYDDEPLPPPPAVPASELSGSASTAPVSEPPASKDGDDADEPSVADASDLATTKKRKGGAAWIWALGGAAIVVAILLPLRGWLAPRPSPEPAAPVAEATPTDPTPSPDEVGAPVAPELTASEPVAAADPIDAGVGQAASPRTPPSNTRANAAGLDPNPYR